MSNGDSSGFGAAGVEFSDAFPSSDYQSNNSGAGSGSFSLLAVDPKLVRHNEKYICPIHKGLLRDAVQTSCGHRLCFACVNDYLGTETSKMCPAGEDDCESVTRDTVVPDPGFRKEIRRVLVFCSNENEGCKEQPQLQHLQSHLLVCDYRKVACPYTVRGCPNDEVVLANLEKHKADCDFRPISCELCGVVLNAKDKKSHDKESCPEATVTCPYNCGVKNLKRKDLENHKLTCPKRPTECQYKSLGCTFSGDKKDVQEHEKNMHLHFEVLLKWVINSEIEKRLHNTEIREMKAQVLELQTINENLSKQIKDNHKDARLKIVSQIERSIQFESTANTQIAELKAELQTEITALKSQLEPLSSQVTAHDRENSGREIRLAEMDLRFQMIETASYNGKLLWKIRDFTQRKRDAVQGRTVSLYSQPFYTSRFGYKMCARVYLNGDGIGRGSHMSLYFVVMRGEYDALLAWPFQHKVSLMLLDQSTEKRHMKDEFYPDPSSTSFRRPVNAEMNVASGCPLFVAHTVLDNPNNQYIKDDVLFIKVMVDTSQLPPL
ncbi:TNF receptor-associated factor 3 [Aplysia californica]|uniref:TNF receptor-associated factor 3 n=1 Tax=Aplysia californica TaxID=6500 RepID=A0ABM0JB72_APLCA|nr:TNF receptor-associated factor 3 [Aplysia californica]